MGLLGADEQGQPYVGVQFIEDAPGLKRVREFFYIPAAERKQLQERAKETEQA